MGERLSLTVSQLVQRARKDVDAASGEARTVQRTGGTIQLVVIVLSLISSGLIVWLYVGRNIVALLTTLSGAMTALAEGPGQSKCRPEEPTRSATWGVRWKCFAATRSSLIGCSLS